MEIILASQSPRRRELLAQMGLTYDVIPSNFDEKLDDNRPPEEVASELALGKAMTVAQEHPDSLVIGSDTIVTVDGKQLEKPRDEAEAKEILAWRCLPASLMKYLQVWRSFGLQMVPNWLARIRQKYSSCPTTSRL